VPVYVPMTEAAQARLVEFGAHMQKRRLLANGLLRSTYGKARGLVLRISLVLEQHLWWCARDGADAPPKVISDAATEAAVTLVQDYMLPMADRVYGDAACSQTDRNISTMARWIAQERPSEVRVRQLQRGEAPAARGVPGQPSTVGIPSVTAISLLPDRTTILTEPTKPNRSGETDPESVSSVPFVILSEGGRGSGWPRGVPGAAS
jgi:hypothetical protein